MKNTMSPEKILGILNFISVSKENGQDISKSFDGLECLMADFVLKTKDEEKIERFTASLQSKGLQSKNLNKIEQIKDYLENKRKSNIVQQIGRTR